MDIQGSTFTAEVGTGAGASNGTIDVEHGSTFAVAGTLNNPGTINLFGSGEQAYLQLVGDTTLKGGGLHLFGYAQIDGNGTLTNLGASQIDGAGTIEVPLNNEAVHSLGGNAIPLIVADNNTYSLSLQAAVTNTGELRGAGSAGLIIQNNVNNIGGLINADFGLVGIKTAQRSLVAHLRKRGEPFLS